MRNIFSFLFMFALAGFIIACGGDGNSASTKKESKTSESVQTESNKSVAPEKSQDNVPASKRVDLVNKGIGPIKNVDIPEDIDRKMAVKGKEIFDVKCVACHRPDATLIGPPPKGVLDIRTPEWVMNMIMNPTEMLEKDPLAMDVLAEFNNIPMIDQNISEEEARALLEYFRTL